MQHHSVKKKKEIGYENFIAYLKKKMILKSKLRLMKSRTMTPHGKLDVVYYLL